MCTGTRRTRTELADASGRSSGRAPRTAKLVSLDSRCAQGSDVASYLIVRILRLDAHRTEVVRVSIALADLALLEWDGARLREMAVSAVVAEV